MKTATENLMDDHDIILQMLEVMENITHSSEPKAEHLEFIVDFIRNFADGLHHRKEEDLLFPAMVQKGIPQENGPVGMMLYEHEQGRNFVKGMADNIIRYKEGHREAINVIYQNMTGYVELLRNHIMKENNILFRMADQVLTLNEQEVLVKKFEFEEQQVENAERRRKYLSMLDELTGVYS